MKKKVLTAICVGLLIRLIVALWNGFWGPSFGAEVDAASFHYWATEFSRQKSPDDIKISSTYSYFLGLIYYLTTDSLFIGSLLSCLTWLASSALLIKIMSLLSISESQKFKIIIIYALLPSSIFYTSVTLREVYQLLFINMAVYYALKIYLKKSASHWIFLFFSVVGMSLLHGALLVFGIIILGATIGLLALRSHTLIKFSWSVTLTFLILFYGLSFSSGVFYTFDDGITVAVANYQEGTLALDARSNYKESVDISGLFDLMLFLPVSLFQYLFEPMPWRMSSIIDLVTMSENLLRAWLIWKAWINIRNINLQMRRLFIFVFLMYLVIESIWSLGTVSWGTAIRHHLPSIGLLLVTAFAYSASKVVSQSNVVMQKSSN
jgi:hypothetical protein